MVTANNADLHRDGVLVTPPTSVPYFLTVLLAELEAYIGTLPNPGPSERKPYLTAWLGKYPKHDPGSPFARIADALMPIAEAYLETPKLFYYNLWQTFPSSDPPRDSQLWHQDIEDTRLLKAFLYLSDVTEGAGPLTYIPGTHWRGSRRIKPKVRLQRMRGERGPLVARVTDEAMAATVPQAEWVTLTVPKGTLVLVDTTGWHKGGYATTCERLCAVWQWTGQTHPESWLR